MSEVGFGLPEAPTFRPSQEEWKDPFEYIACVRRKAELVGLAKIVPPAGWEPPFALDKKRLKLSTQLLSVHQLQSRDICTAEKQFWEGYDAYLEDTGSKVKKKAMYSGQEIDLYRLHRLVAKRGGFEMVTKEKAWKDIVAALQISDKAGSAAYTVKQHYMRLLLPYEDYLKARNKDGAGLLAAAFDAKLVEDNLKQEEDIEDLIDDDEAAEILEAMLGLAPAATQSLQQPKKRRRSTAKDSGTSSQSGIKIPENIFTMVCEKCKGGHSEEKIILCDHCDKGWHMFCLSPPIETVPEGEWVCPTCISKDFEGGAFRWGENLSIEDLERVGSAFERQWFGSSDAATAAPATQREAEFWRVVEEGEDIAEVMRGTGTHSAFPRGPEGDAYAEHPWNLVNMPKAGGDHASLLRVIDANVVPGVTSPRLSTGMLFSSFPWRVEDHLLYSVQYHHWGAPKKWYCIPSHAAGLFEAVFKDALPPDLSKQPGLLFSPSVMVSPLKLRNANVPLYTVTQEAGSFVVTFPNSYHSAVDLGNNCTEQLNIAPADWLRYGAQSVSRYRHFCKPPLFSLEETLVRTAAAAATTVNGTREEEVGVDAAAVPLPDGELRPSPRTCYWVAKDLERVVLEERVMRCKLWSEGLVRSRRIDSKAGMDVESSAKAVECAVCRIPLYLSAVECDCCPHRRTCLHHATNLCECSMRRRRMAWRHTLQELESLHMATRDVVPKKLAEAIEKEEVKLRDAGQRAVTEMQARVEVKKEEAMGGARTKKGKGKVKTEDADDLEALAGFMTSISTDENSAASPIKRNGKRKRSTNGAEQAVAKARTGAAPLSVTFFNSNGYVQGPVRPFHVLDVYPEDSDAVTEWLEMLQEAYSQWSDRAKSALEQGGALADELPDLVEGAEQFMWGGTGEDIAEEVRSLQPRLANAEDYMAAVHAALKGKPTLDAVNALLSQEPKPLANPPGLDTLVEAVAAAYEWRSRTAELCSPEAPPVEARVLEAAVNEASRLPITLPEAKALRERLTMARKVADAIRIALPTARESGRRKKDDGAITVESLQRLRSQAIASRVDLPEVGNLTVALDRIEAWQQRVDATSHTRGSLAELRSLLEDGETLPAVLPELDHIRSVVEKGDNWLAQMHTLMTTKGSLKKLRDLLHLGVRLPVETPEVEQLRQQIRRMEWLETAKKVTAPGRGTLHGLIEVLATASEMGAEDMDVAVQIEAKVRAAKDWDDRAKEFIGRLHVEGGLTEDQRPWIEELSAVVYDGQATGVRMERLTTLSHGLNAASKWLEKAQKCLPPPQAAEEELSTVSDNNAEGAPIQMQAAKEYENGQKCEASVHIAPPTATAAEKPIQMMPQYGVIDALIQEYEQNLVIQAAEAKGLRVLRQNADAWLESARSVLEQEFVVDEQLPLLNELIAKGKATGVAMEQVDILDANVEALLWAQQVRDILAKLPQQLQKDPGPAPVAALEAPRAPASVDTMQPTRGTPPVLEGTETAKDEAMPLAEPADVGKQEERGHEGEEEDPGVKYQEELMATAASAHPGLCFGIPPVDLDPDPTPSDDEWAGPDLEPNTHSYDERPSLPILIKLLEEGSILPCDEKTFLRFKRCVEAGLEWERAARAALAFTKDGGPATLVDVRDLRRMATRGERLGMAIPVLSRMHDVLRAHGKWEQRVRDLMATAGARPAFAELQVFQQTARLSPVNSNLRRHIDAAVDAVDDWKERCRRIIAKRNTGMRLERCLEVLGHSVHCAVEQFERRLELEKRLVSAGPRRTAPGAEDEDESELYCLCQQPYNVDTSMISCDLCGEWFHIRCVGLSQTQARSLRKYTCPICAAVRNMMDPLEYSLGKLRRTQRPHRNELGQLLAEIKVLPATVEEEAGLERVLLKCDRWATATNRAVEVHEASRRKDSDGQVAPLSDAMLHQLCKSALAMEIDATDHVERILHLLRCNRWRARVDVVLAAGSADRAPGAPPGKASAEAVAKLLIEAERLDVDTEADVAGVRLLEAADAAKRWKDAVSECISRLKEAGSAHDPRFEEAAAQAKELAKEAGNLPIRVDRELEKLTEYSKPYCLCRRTYDVQIPMLECDVCSEWYHFECVGLKAPGAGDEGSDPVPDRFSCPVCCMRSGSKYPFFGCLPSASLNALKEMAETLPAPGALPAVGTAPATATPREGAQSGGEAQGLQKAATNSTAMQAQSAAAQAMYAPGWQYAAAAMGRGGVPMQMMPGMSAAMMNPQVLAQMMEASFPNGMPVMHPGMMFTMVPGMHHAMVAAAAQQQVQQQVQAQQRAAAAAARATEPPANHQEEKETEKEVTRESGDIKNSGGEVEGDETVHPSGECP